MKFLRFGQSKLGSSLSLRAHGWAWDKGNILGGAFREAKYEIWWRNPSSRTLCVHYGARSEGRNPERGEKRKLYNLAAGLGILRLRLRITFLYFLYEKIT